MKNEITNSETYSSIAKKLNMSYNTFRKCIEPILHELQDKEQTGRKILTPREIDIICKHLGVRD